jgi:hypothetical protein
MAETRTPHQRTSTRRPRYRQDVPGRERSVPCTSAPRNPSSTGLQPARHPSFTTDRMQCTQSSTATWPAMKVHRSSDPAEPIAELFSYLSRRRLGLRAALARLPRRLDWTITALRPAPSSTVGVQQPAVSLVRCQGSDLRTGRATMSRPCRVDDAPLWVTDRSASTPRRQWRQCRCRAAGTRHLGCLTGRSR